MLSLGSKDKVGGLSRTVSGGSMVTQSCVHKDKQRKLGSESATSITHFPSLYPHHYSILTWHSPFMRSAVVNGRMRRKTCRCSCSSPLGRFEHQHTGKEKGKSDMMVQRESMKLGHYKTKPCIIIMTVLLYIRIM